MAGNEKLHLIIGKILISEYYKDHALV